MCAESRQLNVIQDPDYTLIVRVEDLGGGAPTALSSITRVNIAVTQNLWISPGLLPIMENLKTDYPMLLTTVSLGLRGEKIHHKTKCNSNILDLLTGL